jgi:hypothetical protein
MPPLVLPMPTSSISLPPPVLLVRNSPPLVCDWLPPPPFRARSDVRSPAPLILDKDELAF